MVKRGVAASWRGSRCREDGGRRNGKWPRRSVLGCLFSWERECGGVWAAAELASRSGPGGFVLTSLHLSLVLDSPDCPGAVFLPSVGNSDFPAALARGAVALRDVLVSVGPGISAEASRGQGGG